ncbi:hypothetical protein BGZ99_002232 [Dissophora globulifera]|uniref:Pentatricopeptide repeat-containing protein-mitochondrial domain-containing protein n=1 Tax=Dissophora globulifera TaxID=979702 RepID=A0A9P6RQM1_9FUNG|nr:hypothetical protein BGZ99_002232 [Dissophora globulifera]
MSHLAALLGRRALLSNSTLSCFAPSRHAKPQSVLIAVRGYSSRTKSKVQIETSDLAREIQQLERTIAEQERKLAAKQAYEESIRHSKQRSEEAASVYKGVMSPLPSASSPNPNTKSYLPETFLQDLQLTFLDTRGTKEETIKLLQDGLPSNEELKSAATGSGSNQWKDVSDKTSLDDPASALQHDQSLAALERVRRLGIDKWNQLILANALDGNFKNAEQAMQLMEEIGVQPNMESFNHLMEAYANSGELSKAHNTIELMLASGLIPSISAYNSLMKIYVQRRDITGTFQVFEALKEHHNPEVDVFTNLVKGCLRAGEYDLGWKVFDQMQHSGAIPTESTYSLMIQACARTDQVEKALDIFRTYPSRGLQPTDSTFNSLIHACAMRPEYFATAFALLNEMQQSYGFEPDISTYNTLLFACSKRRDLLTARRIFQKVVQLDSEGTLKLDGVTVTNFLWCVTEWKDTEAHLRNHKLRDRSSNKTHIDSSSTASPATDITATDMTSRPAYFLLPARPPKDEWQALVEGEAVFSWFLTRSAEQYALTEAHNETSIGDSATELLIEDKEEADQEITTINDIKQVPYLPLLSPRSPIRTRLLNAYLAMYVRHHDIDKATEIYKNYFDHFKRKRDSWTYSAMLEGCYHWKNVDLGAEVFKDWRDWRKSTGRLTEKRTRQADYQCYRRMINLLARTNHLDESIALLEELSIAATPTNTRLRLDIESAQVSGATRESIPSKSASTLATSLAPSSTSAPGSSSNALSFLNPIQDEAVLPKYPKLKDFPIVYTKTWELEDESARRLLLRICHGKVDSKEQEDTDDGSILPSNYDKRQSRSQKSLRNTAIKWNGQHPQEKGLYVGSRRMKELDKALSKRSQDQHSSKASTRA